MKDEDFKKIIEQSEVTSSFDFTDTIISEIEKVNRPVPSVVFWTLSKIVIGFVGVAILSGILMFSFLNSGFFGNFIVPILWAFLLLIGLNHLLALHKCQSILEINHKGMTPTKETLQL